MKTVLFIMFRAVSHVNGTIALARQLQKDGYRIIYTAPAYLKSFIESIGFEVYVEEPYFTAFPLYRHAYMDNLNDFKTKYLNGRIFETVLKKTKPALVILDTSFVNAAIELKTRNIPVLIVQTMCSIKKKPNVPPIHTEVIPGRYPWSRFIVEIAWMKYFCIQALRDFAHRVLYGTSEFKLLRQKAAKDNIPLNQINFKSYLHINVKFFPELIIPPRSFDFPQSFSDHEIFPGYFIDTERKGYQRHEKFENLKEQIFQKDVIYCSSGTLLPTDTSFISKLIQIALQRPDLHFILHLGSIMRVAQVREIPPNVFAFDGMLPQLEILKNTKIMLTHGGVNSVMECIFYEVPMIVFPAAKELDQPGNAARVVFHKIGLSAAYTNSADTIHKKIRAIENHDIYRKNIKALKEKIISEQNNDLFRTLVNNLIERTGQQVTHHHPA